MTVPSTEIVAGTPEPIAKENDNMSSDKEQSTGKTEDKPEHTGTPPQQPKEDTGRK